MICKICQREFIPNKYRPQQKVCSEPECQRKRQFENVKDWQRRNPDYFKYGQSLPSWKERHNLSSKRWRQKHVRHLKKYWKEHKEFRRLYMKEYMRRYRKRVHPPVNEP